MSFVDDDLDRYEHLGNALTKNEGVLGEREGGGKKHGPVGLVIHGRLDYDNSFINGR